MEENTNTTVEVEETKDVEQNSTQKQQEETKTFTQEEVNKIVQDRLAKEKSKNEKAQEEAKKLAKMNAEEKARYELQKAQEKLKTKELELNKRELTATAKEILADIGLPTELHSLLNYESADTVNDGIKSLEKAIQKTVEARVNEKLKGNPPKKGDGTQAEVDYFMQGTKL